MSTRASTEIQDDLSPNGKAAAGGSKRSAGASRGRGRRQIAKPENLAAEIRRVMTSRNLSTREVVKRVPRRHVGTVYRLLAGRTTDPWASTVVSLCTALGADPDELLNIRDALEFLDPELRQMLEEVERLPEEDRWLILDTMRAMLVRLQPEPKK